MCLRLHHYAAAKHKQHGEDMDWPENQTRGPPVDGSVPGGLRQFQLSASGNAQGSKNKCKFPPIFTSETSTTGQIRSAAPAGLLCLVLLVILCSCDALIAEQTHWLALNTFSFIFSEYYFPN